MNFKKNISILAGICFIVTAMMFVAATVGERGAFGDNTQVIYNSNSGDVASAISLKDYINESCGIESCSINNTEIIIGEIKTVKTSSQPLYLGDIMSDTKSTFTDSQLPTVLASGEVEGDDGKDYDYDLKISVPNSYVLYGETTDDFNTPIIYADFQGDESYSLRIIFPTAVDMDELAGEIITLFGKEYSFTEEEDDLSIESITLFEKSTSVKINSGETLVIGDDEIKVDVEDTNNAVIYVNGISKNVDDDDWSGKIGGLDIHVKTIFAPNVAGQERYVRISLNAEKLTLEDGSEVELGTESIEGTNVVIKESGDKVREIVITITPSELDDEVEYLKIGDSLTDPVFGTISFMLDSVTPELKSDDRDYIKVRTTGTDDANIVFTNMAGGEYDFEFIKDGNFNLQNKTVLKEEYFITISNGYTQIWELEKVSLEEIKVRDQAKNSDSLEISVTDNKADLSLADGGSITLTVNGDNIIAPEFRYRLYTENGAKIDFLNISDLVSITLTEKTDYNGGTFTDNSGTSIEDYIKIYSYYDSGDLELGILNTEYIYQNDDDTYALTRYGTYIKETNENKVEVYYPFEAMEIVFQIGEIESELQIIPIDGKVSRVVIGGSCVSQEAANLLGIGRLCGEEFTAATNVGAGKVLIRTYADGDNTKILIAGYHAADTARGVTHLKENSEDYLTTGISKII